PPERSVETVRRFPARLRGPYGDGATLSTKGRPGQCKLLPEPGARPAPRRSARQSGRAAGQRPGERGAEPPMKALSPHPRPLPQEQGRGAIAPDGCLSPSPSEE